MTQGPVPSLKTNPVARRSNLPPQVRQAQQFLLQRGLRSNRFRGRPPLARRAIAARHPDSAATAAWQPIGPTAVASLTYGLTTGRVTALAIDPSDATGNRLYLGTSGGGVWFSQNAAAAVRVVFSPLTDTVAGLSVDKDASISIGALTVQPGGTSVILAGTGDPNDALDSYYGAGILRSADGGNTWTVISESADPVAGQSQNFSFAGEGFAGFAWSTVNPQLAVAAVSQAYEGTLVNAGNPQVSYEGLYYSPDGGVTWRLATITDGAGEDVQGPADAFVEPDGNAATSVVWNSQRSLFVAAVRFHGYYQSYDGITWTRLAAQPGSGLTTAFCPNNPGATGSPACPIFRGTLAVNPLTGDTFAWTVDIDNQDQGLWQDACALSGNACTNQSITFAKAWNTAQLETDDSQGAATIENGDYNLALAAVPSEQDTLLLAGENDLWKCSLAAGCVWRNTTNSNTCLSAQVAGYQHALAWSAGNPAEVFIGNDGGIWRSLDAIAETGSACAPGDARHFQNLNGSLGSLAEVVSMAEAPSTPNTMMLGLGVNGTAGVKGSSLVADWPEIVGGEGGPVEIDPGNSSNWYVNNAAGVSIRRCSQAAACTPASFGPNPLVNDADVDNDGLTMTTAAPFLVDPLDGTQLLIGTCRVWRGPAGGMGAWSTGNAISPILDGNALNVSCNGDALIRTVAAAATAGGGERVYVGMYGAEDGGAPLAGHVFGAALNPGSMASPVWQDLTLNPVTNDTAAMNALGFDISSIFIDPHDLTGRTVYVTVEGYSNAAETAQLVYGTTDGGAHWANLSSNLLPAPANSVTVDPQDANTVYIATDRGVFSTRQISNCTSQSAACWTAYGTGLPEAPAVLLAATPATAAANVLTVATYGRGVWEIPLWTAGTILTSATAAPASLTFLSQVYATKSSAQTATLTNTGTVALTAVIAMSRDFSESDNCQAAAVKAGASCAIQVTFTPTQTGSRTGLMTIAANVPGGQLTVALSGTGVSAGAMNLIPAALSFGQVQAGTTSAPLQITVTNSGGSAITITAASTTGPFSVAGNQCGSQLGAGQQCQVTVQFAPTQAGAATGALTMTDSAGTQTVQLSGTGAAPPTDALSATSIAFPATVNGQQSPPQTLVLTNNGDLPLTSIGTSVTGAFAATQNCGGTLPGHSSCAVSVIFAPIQLGSQTGSVIVSDALRQQAVSLSGVGVQPPAFTVTPAKLSFAAQEVGTAGTAQPLTVSNTGGAPMANVGLQIVGQSGSSFAWSANTCGAVLNNGSSCSVQVTFTPATTGGNAALLVISSSTVGVTAATVPLSGTGLAPPALSVSPPAMQFASVVVGATSVNQQVTVSNTGGVALNDMRLAISGDFGFSAGSCAAVLAAGASCAATITFSPTATGTRTGVFTASSVSGASPPATVSLTGNGAGPASIQTSAGLLAFGNQAAGQVSAAKTLTVFDVGTVSLSGLTLTVAGPFQLQQDQCGNTLGANSNCTTQVVFTPAVTGAQTGTLTVASTTQWVAPVVVALTGTGTPAPVLQVSPLQLAFGGVQVGSSSSPLSVAIADSGSLSLAGLGLTVSGDFGLSNNTCATSLAAGAGCSTQVIFSPTSGGNRTGTLTVSGTSAGVVPVAVSLSGTGQAPGSLEGTPSNLSFASVTVGQTSAPQTATVTNSGQIVANGIQFRLSGDYGLSNGTCGTSMAGGANCTVQVTFSPSAAGNRTGSIAVSSTTAGVGPAQITLGGAGVPAAYLTVTPSQVTFPSTVVGLASSAIPVTLSNPGMAPLGGLQVQTVGDFSASQSQCPAVLPAGGNCPLQIFFNPTAQGNRTGQLTVNSTTPGVPPVQVSLSGTATQGSLSLNHSILAFPGVATGQTSPAITIVVSNAGSAPLNAPVLAITGESTDFPVISNSCSAPLAPQGTCNLQVEFIPTATGGRSALLTVSTTSAGVIPEPVVLTGTGLTPASLGVGPLQMSFPVTITGQSSAAQTVTVTNTGGAGATAMNLTVTPNQFSVTQNTCTGTLASGANCTAGVVFSPTQTAGGTVTGGLTVSSTSVAAQASVPLSGIVGVPPAIQLQPTVLPFPLTGVGITSDPITITVTNPGTINGLTGLALYVTPNSGFQLVQNACGATLGPMSSCSTGVVFAPAGVGPQVGSLSVTANGVQAVPPVFLGGSGYNFTLAVLGSASQSVASGQTASFELSVKPQGNVKPSLFTYQCSTVPQMAYATCTFNPPNGDQVSAGTSSPIQVLVETGQGSNANSARTTGGWSAFSLACGLMLLPLAWSRRRKAMLWTTLLAILAGGVCSCLGASGSVGQHHPTGPGVTPPGNYQINVTVVSNGVQITAPTFMLTVD